LLIALWIFSVAKIAALLPMPVVIDKTIHSNTRLAVWRITEKEENLRARLILNTSEEAYLEGIKTEKKRLQWFASRCLIRMMMNTSAFIAMHASESGQPVISNTNKKVSISHAGQHAAVIISDTTDVGVDIEELTTKVMLIKHKFIGDAEMDWMKNETSIEKHLLMWSAKESLYKWYAKGNIDFRLNLLLQSFSLNTNGVIQSTFKNEEVEKNLDVHYEFFDNCVLTWVMG
jgi:4'-phosphopantetheinyl transferase